MSVFRHTPLPRTQQPHCQPSPLKRVEFASKLQEKIHAANAAEHRENFAARKIQPRPAVRPDMTGCGTSQKMHTFQTSKRRQPRRRTRRHALRSSNTDAFKMPLKRLADAFASIQISLKAKRVGLHKKCKPSPVHGRARQRRVRVRANKNQYYIYDVYCAFGVTFYAKKARKICILPRQDIRFASF